MPRRSCQANGLAAVALELEIGCRLAFCDHGRSLPEATLSPRADVAELVDAHGSGPCGLRLVEVQVLSSASLVDCLRVDFGGRQADECRLDVEIAIDTTGSMGPHPPSARRGKLVPDQGARDAERAVVQFKDAGDTPEYELLQPLTGDSKAIAHVAHRSGGGGDNPEAYNVVFRNSYADKAIGWRDGSRKVVVVIGDAEPHGAGQAGLPVVSTPSTRTR